MSSHAMEASSSAVEPRAQRHRAPPTWMRGEECATPADLAQHRRENDDAKDERRSGRHSTRDGGVKRKHKSGKKSRGRQREDERQHLRRHRHRQTADERTTLLEARRRQRTESLTVADREARGRQRRESVTEAERDMMDALESGDGRGALAPELRLAANLLATRHPRAALIKWAMDSGFDHFTLLIAALPRSDDPVALASAHGQAAIEAIIAMIKSITRSHAQTQKAIELYKGSMDHDSLHQLTCAACGVRSYVNRTTADRHFPYYDIGDDLTRLRLSEEQVEEYLAVDEQYRQAFSVYHASDEHYYYLHDDFVEPSEAAGVEHGDDTHSHGRVRICASCDKSLQTDDDRREAPPPCSIAAVFDYGKPWMIPNLHRPNLLEELLIGVVTVDMVVVKLSGPTGFESTQMSALTGNAISFPHNGPSVAAAELPDIAKARSCIKIVLLAPDGKIDRHKKAAKECSRLTVRPTVVV